MNSAAVSATTQIAPPSHLFQIPAEVTPPYADFVPTKSIRSPATPHRLRVACRPSKKHSLPLQDLRHRKTLRTVMLSEDGSIVGAKIELATMKVVPHEFKDYYKRWPKPKADPNAPDTDPFWMQMPAAERSVCFATNHDNSRKKLFNGVKMYLEGYLTLDEALEDLPMLDDLVTGATALEMQGSTRPLNRRLLFAMLQQLDVITTETIRAFMGCSTRHAQRVGQCLRIIVRAFEQETMK